MFWPKSLTYPEIDELSQKFKKEEDQLLKRKESSNVLIQGSI